jgi:hypothetical protein
MNPNATWLQFDFTVSIQTAAAATSNMHTPADIRNTTAVGNAAVFRDALGAAGGNVYTTHDQFYRLPSCGAMAFISDMQIVVQGCPIEEIHRYNTMATYL